MREIDNPGPIKLFGSKQVVLTDKDVDPKSYMLGDNFGGYISDSGFFLLVSSDINVTEPWKHVVYWDSDEVEFYQIPKEAFLYAEAKWDEETVYVDAGIPITVPKSSRRPLESLTVMFKGSRIQLLKETSRTTKEHHGKQ